MPTFADHFTHLLTQAKSGDLPAQREVGQTLLKGTLVPRDPPAGRAWLEKAIAANDPEAMFLLGHHDLFGGRHGRGPLVGWALLARAAELDHAQAQYSLGAAINVGLHIEDEEQRRLYFERTGLPASPCQAATWLERARTNGWPPPEAS